MRLIFTSLGVFFVLCIIAQPQHVPVVFKSSSTDVLNHALSGGLTNPQYSSIDLNGDNLKDLVYFDLNSLDSID